MQLHELVARFDTDTVSRGRDVQMCVDAPIHIHWFGSNAKEHHVHGKRGWKPRGMDGMANNTTIEERGHTM